MAARCNSRLVATPTVGIVCDATRTGRREEDGKPLSSPDMAVQRVIKNEIPDNYVTRDNRVRGYAFNLYKALSLMKEAEITVKIFYV